MKSLSITKPKFGQKNSKMAVILLFMPFLLGILSVLLNWKAFLCALVLVSIFYSLKKFAFQYSFAKTASGVVLIIVAYLILVSATLSVSIWETLLSTFFLSFFFLVRNAYEDSRKASDFEVFLINGTRLKCIATKMNDYKGYTLNPKGYVKWYPLKEITGLHFSEKYLTVILGTQRIYPRELNAADLISIYDYCLLHFPKLVAGK